MSEKPTEEQVTEFWEKLKPTPKDWDEYNRWLYYGYPPIDPNNLFKWTVDWGKIETIQFSKGDNGCHCWIYTKKLIGKPFHGNGLTEEDSLFWAVYEVMKNE